MLREKIRVLREKARKLLLEKDSLNIFEEKLREQDADEESGIYGLDDEFIRYLKLKIQQLK
jgi:hypothetical protein